LTAALYVLPWPRCRHHLRLRAATAARHACALLARRPSASLAMGETAPSARAVRRAVRSTPSTS